MKPFVVLRVPARLLEGEHVRRDGWGINPTVVAECETREEAEEAVGRLSFKDERHHYYGLELAFSGDPEFRRAIPANNPIKMERKKQ